MSDDWRGPALIFYGLAGGTQVLGPYHPDEMSARARAVHALNGRGRAVYMIRANTYEEARRKCPR